MGRSSAFIGQTRKKVMTDTSNMPAYECHKIVHALEVASVGNYKNNPELGSLVRAITFVDGTTRDLKDDIFKRYVPDPGDFYVVYEDGYEWFSPRKAFLDGYKQIDTRTFRDIKDSIVSGTNLQDKPSNMSGYPAAGGSGSASQHPTGEPK